MLEIILLFVLAAALFVGYFVMDLVDHALENSTTSLTDSKKPPLTFNCSHHVYRKKAS